MGALEAFGAMIQDLAISAGDIGAYISYGVIIVILCVSAYKFLLSGETGMEFALNTLKRLVISVVVIIMATSIVAFAIAAIGGSADGTKTTGVSAATFVIEDSSE